MIYFEIYFRSSVRQLQKGESQSMQKRTIWDDRVNIDTYEDW